MPLRELKSSQQFLCEEVVISPDNDLLSRGSDIELTNLYISIKNPEGKIPSGF